MNMKDKIKKFLDEKKEIIKELKKYVKDKSISLNDRWDLFIISELGDHDGYYFEPKGIDWNKHTLYDDFHTDKYGTLNCKEMLEIAIENEIFEEGSQEEIDFKES